MAEKPSPASENVKEGLTKGVRPAFKPTNGCQVLTFSHYILASYGTFNDGAQLMQVLCRASRTYFRRHGTYLKKYQLEVRPKYYCHVSEATKKWEIELIALRLQGKISLGKLLRLTNIFNIFLIGFVCGIF